MKRKIIIILTMMPLLALGQSKMTNDILGNGDITSQDKFEKHLIWQGSSDLERHIETPLINDTKYFRSILNFDLDNTYNLSFNVKNKNMLNLHDDFKLDEIQMEEKSLLDFKRYLRTPSETKSLFEH